ncbi:CsbD family protein [Amycolatopsis sp. QT-25]|uniref:CsbD family protein n=1 Tax=Amycolatopsis sp. QT-25 TaxID=3034022 RepID=UPI0023EB98CE|nr:CsbD family protein [Amycolatopsis sp. QT-25]WET79326.1 CsbD family protein [Amycolatopsis sp. QT-25]HET6288964.1 CsbD family protein [Amycolatopsis sp.]
MSVFDKAKDKAEQAIGAAKEKLGEKTGNQDVANSGRADQTEGQVKETGHDLRDRAEGGVQDLKDKFNK